MGGWIMRVIEQGAGLIAQDGAAHDLRSKNKHAQQSMHREAIMRALFLPLMLALVTVIGGEAKAKAGTELSCPSSPLISEGSSTDKQQLELLSKQATACVREGKPTQAVALLTEVIRRAPTNAAAYLNRGSAQAAAGEVALALGDYTTALHLQPDLVEAWYDRGTTFTHLRRYENAITDFTEAIRLKPDFALAYCNRGLANLQLGHFDDALADYSVAIAHDAALTYCYFNRGNLYLTLGEYQKAIDDLTRALATNTKDATALSRRGQAYEALGQLDEALDNFREALEIAPGLESAEEGFARITEQQKRTDGGRTRR
jgi:tetratricopeptide (TPR) repeat protein